MLRVIATIRAREGCEQRLADTLRGLVEPSRAEDGCAQYDLLQSLDQPGLFTVVESWSDREALDRHAASDHVQAARARYPELVDGTIDIRLCRRL